eukprot:scaffold174732_cov22-Tisochrysis_lutea.AAC.1
MPYFRLPGCMPFGLGTPHFEEPLTPPHLHTSTAKRYHLLRIHTPQAVRNFVQLCLEGYYDNTIFHRVIRDYMAQGGDPTGTGT